MFDWEKDLAVRGSDRCNPSRAASATGVQVELNWLGSFPKNGRLCRVLCAQSLAVLRITILIGFCGQQVEMWGWRAYPWAEVLLRRVILQPWHAGFWTFELFAPLEKMFHCSSLPQLVVFKKELCCFRSKILRAETCSAVVAKERFIKDHLDIFHPKDPVTWIQIAYPEVFNTFHLWSVHFRVAARLSWAL